MSVLPFLTQLRNLKYINFRFLHPKNTDDMNIHTIIKVFTLSNVNQSEVAFSNILLTLVCVAQSYNPMFLYVLDDT